jgi:DHA2 family methylenomycin A resistance protein-like MFS transporter
MVLVGLGGPLVMPPTMAVLLDHAPDQRAGTASAVFNTSRQIGGALAVAVFGGLLTNPDTFLSGVRTSLRPPDVMEHPFRSKWSTRSDGNEAVVPE